VSVSDNIMLF